MWTYPPHIQHRLSSAEERRLDHFLAALHAATFPGMVGSVRLYGSRARGDERAESLEIAIVVPREHFTDDLRGLAADLAHRTMDAFGNYDVWLQTLVIADHTYSGMIASRANAGFDIWRAEEGEG